MSLSYRRKYSIDNVADSAYIPSITTTKEREVNEMTGTMTIDHRELRIGQRVEATWHTYTAEDRQYLKKSAQKDEGYWLVQLRPTYGISLRPRDFRPDSVAS